MKTKTNLFFLLALFFITPAMHSHNTNSGSSSKNMNQLFKEFSKKEGVERVNLGRVSMGFVRLFTGIKGVSEIEMLDFSDCCPRVKDRINREIISLRDADYETLISVNDEGERVRILVKLKNDAIRELIVMTAGNEPALIRIKGKIRPSEVENIMNKSNISKR
ncbi:MAG: DUF4252 domain-containing protein [Bacteroidales bacterium]|jgi:hypothetical protein|nr:DUF4252 domain-containing protein [Bacteroidales bacterium]